MVVAEPVHGGAVVCNGLDRITIANRVIRTPGHGVIANGMCQIDIISWR